MCNFPSLLFQVPINWLFFFCVFCFSISVFIDFFVLWSIYVISFLVHLKNSPGYLTRGTAWVFILWMRSLLQSLVSWRFLILLRNFFLTFFHFCWIVSTCNIPKLLVNFFFLSVPILFWGRVFVFCVFFFLVFLFYSFRCSSLPTFHFEHSTFFNAKFHSYILAV